ncbi:hypothetical protein P9726_03350 [Geobacillus stearothermophilus]|uniref:hypothetical protein n=1 Tax=Geobacillus stearothermophilus TaxID=1422 RepID=UPI00155E08D7|nr:hypothetical protein [Geobacillus stearothermophilus]MED4978755.1 hypothetical protein [Geobacillus stearothermophilus]NNV07111.1 hypothetical protein [Geobacillus sp. MMMUD3]
MNIVRKPVAFNLDDPDQKELYDHAMKRTNFSAYIKRLIQRDMENGNAPRMSAPSLSHEFDVSEFI